MDFGDALNKALREEMRRDPRVYCIGEDIVLGVPFGVTKGLCEEFGPARVLNAPISEAAIVGSAMGAAMTGLVPVVDMHFADFVTCAMDEVANQIAKSRYMFGGQIDCPLTLRMPYGIGRSGGGHHSNSVEAWFVNIPGLKVCIPSTPADARGLLKTAIRDPDPVLVFEHRGLYRVSGEVGDVETLVPLGSADVKRAGRDVTVIATARMVHESLAAARRLAEEGIEVEVVDPRSLVPLDRATLADSVRRTHHVVIAEEGPMRGSTGAWLAWVLMEECFDELDAPVARVAGPNVRIPLSTPPEKLAPPDAHQGGAAVLRAPGEPRRLARRARAVRLDGPGARARAGDRPRRAGRAADLEERGLLRGGARHARTLAGGPAPLSRQRRPSSGRRRHLQGAGGDPPPGGGRRERRLLPGADREGNRPRGARGGRLARRGGPGGARAGVARARDDRVPRAPRILGAAALFGVPDARDA